MPVPNDLPRLRQRAGEAEPIADVIEPALEQHLQLLAGEALHPVSHREVRGELRFHQAINALALLLLAQPNREFGETRTCLSVRAGRIIAPLDRALVAVASLSLEEEFQSFASAKTADRSQVSRHVKLRSLFARG